MIDYGVQVEKTDSESARLQQELQDSKDQNELLEFRILELEVSHKEFPTKPLLSLHDKMSCELSPEDAIVQNSA